MTITLSDKEKEILCYALMYFNSHLEFSRLTSKIKDKKLDDKLDKESIMYEDSAKALIQRLNSLGRT